MTWHLLLDYDSADAVPGYRLVGGVALPDQANAHHIIRKRLARAGYKVTAWSFERSTNGWHAKVSLDRPPDSPMEVVALQAVCGSDPLRESCNVQRARMAEHVADSAAHPDATRVERDAADFWLQRWNVLYRPNPNRVKESNHAG